MPITYQSGSGWEGTDGTNSTTHIFTPTNAAANGNLAIVCAGNSGTRTSVSVSGGGVATWTMAKEAIATNIVISIYYGIADGTGGAITITWIGKNSTKDVMFAAFAGTVSSSILDVTGTTTGTSTNYQSGSNSSVTTNAGDLAIGAIGHASTSGAYSAGPTNSFTDIATPQTTLGGVAAAYRILTATGTYSTDWTATNSRLWAGAIAMFFPAVAAFLADAPLIVGQARHRAASY